MNLVVKFGNGMSGSSFPLVLTYLTGSGMIAMSHSHEIEGICNGQKILLQNDALKEIEDMR